MPEPGPDTGDSENILVPTSGPGADDLASQPTLLLEVEEVPAPGRDAGEDDQPTEIIHLLLPMSVTAWCALVNGLTEVYPDAVLIDGPPEQTTIRLGQPRV